MSTPLDDCSPVIGASSAIFTTGSALLLFDPSPAVQATDSSNTANIVSRTIFIFPPYYPSGQPSDATVAVWNGDQHRICHSPGMAACSIAARNQFRTSAS